VHLVQAQFAHLRVGTTPVAQIEVGPVRVANSDPHFAVTTVTPRNRQGRILDNSAALVLMEAGGTWAVILGPGTAFPEECQRPTPRPIRQLMCPNPYAVLGRG